VIKSTVLTADEAVLVHNDGNDIFLLFTKETLNIFLQVLKSVAKQIFTTLVESAQFYEVILLDNSTNDLRSIYYKVEERSIFGLKLNTKNDGERQAKILELNSRCDKLVDFFVEYIATIPASVRYRGALAHEKTHAQYFSRGVFYYFFLRLMDREVAYADMLYGHIKIFEEVGTARQEILSGANSDEQTQLLLLRLSHFMADFRMYLDEKFKKSTFQKEVEEVYVKKDKAKSASPYVVSTLILLFAETFTNTFNTENETNLVGILGLDPLIDRSKSKEVALLELFERVVVAIEAIKSDPTKALKIINDQSFERWIDWHFQAKVGELMYQAKKIGIDSV
jgi:hypothetical protein